MRSLGEAQRNLRVGSHPNAGWTEMKTRVTQNAHDIAVSELRYDRIIEELARALTPVP